MFKGWAEQAPSRFKALLKFSNTQILNPYFNSKFIYRPLFHQMVMLDLHYRQFMHPVKEFLKFLTKTVFVSPRVFRARVVKPFFEVEGLYPSLVLQVQQDGPCSLHNNRYTKCRLQGNFRFLIMQKIKIIFLSLATFCLIKLFAPLFKCTFLC